MALELKRDLKGLMVIFGIIMALFLLTAMFIIGKQHGESRIKEDLKSCFKNNKAYKVNNYIKAVGKLELILGAENVTN